LEEFAEKLKSLHEGAEPSQVGTQVEDSEECDKENILVEADEVEDLEKKV
jgi:hypothetical protein